MATTAVYALPYQVLTDPPNGAALGQNLAEAVETELVRVDAAVAASALIATFARKLTNESLSSSIALQNDDALFVANLVANAVYRVELSVQYFAAAAGTTPGMRVDFTVPAGASVGNMSFEVTGSLGRASTNGAVTGISAATTVEFFREDGLLVMGASAGTLQFRWAQNVSSASATTVGAGSYLQLTRIS